MIDEEPASDSFCEMISLVRDAVDIRRQASGHDGLKRLTLDRTADGVSREADDILKRIMGGTDGIGAKATDPVARASRG